MKGGRTSGGISMSRIENIMRMSAVYLYDGDAGRRFCMSAWDLSRFRYIYLNGKRTDFNTAHRVLKRCKRTPVVVDYPDGEYIDIEFRDIEE